MDRSSGRQTGGTSRVRGVRERLPFIALCVFFLCVMLMGGGSRDDIESNMVLRPIAILFAAYAFLSMGRAELERVRIPLYLLVALMLIVAVQLIPLPPTMWASLPGHQLVADVLADAGVQQAWRPLTLSPAETMNTLFSLSIPLAALLLLSLQKRTTYRRIIWVLIAGLALSALWGLAQIAGPDDSPLYTYRITNSGAPVGLFANRNHQAVALAALVPSLIFLSMASKWRSGAGLLESVASVGILLILLPSVLLTGSRMGIVLAVCALAGGTVLFLLFSQPESHRQSAGRMKQIIARYRAALLYGVVGVVVLLAIFLARAPSLDRLFDTNLTEESRLELWPVLLDMAGHYFPLGAGFGTFEHVFKIFEPSQILTPAYFNQAHNDPMQILIEGGVAALILCLAFLFLFARQVIRRLWLDGAPSGQRQIAGAATLGILVFLGGSLSDYPLRTPIGMVMFATFLFILFGREPTVSKRK